MQKKVVKNFAKDKIDVTAFYSQANYSLFLDFDQFLEFWFIFGILIQCWIFRHFGLFVHFLDFVQCSFLDLFLLFIFWIFLVGHQAVIRCLLAYYTETPEEDLPWLEVPLHTVIKLSPVAYGCKMEKIEFDVPKVSTHRTKPVKDGILEQK